jgi:LmbE family N-acetylglucosaminyl deacetylase
VPGERTAELTPKEWVSALQLLQPDGIVFPHAEDGHPTHQRCSQLVADVVPLWVSSSGKRVHLFQTGYWQDLPDPNLFIELSAEHVIRMGTALLEHRGEVSRNPYHLGLPSHLADSRRKGIERVAGMGSVDQGGCVFAQLYHHSIKS